MSPTDRAKSDVHRGVAMLLVLVALGTATILTTAYLASRDNSAAIGENIAESARARWAAYSGLEAAIAVLQTQANWQTSHKNGKLLDDFPLSGALVDLDLIDLTTGQPPTADSTNVELRVTAVVDGVAQTARAVAKVYGLHRKITVDLSEFVIFADDRIVLEGSATTTRWAKAPLSNLGARMALGTRKLVAGTVNVAADAAVIDATVYTGPGSSSSLVINSSGTVIDQSEVPDLIPLPAAPEPAVALPSDLEYPELKLAGTAETLSEDARHGRIQLTTASLTLDDGVTLTVDGDMKMAASAIRVSGHATLVVYGRMELDFSAILLEDGATLDAYLADRFEMHAAYIGNERDAFFNDIAGGESWMDVRRIKIFGLPSAAATWTVDHSSVIKGSVYAPQAGFELRESALYGRVAAAEVVLKKDGSIFYDPLLDDRTGYTNPESLLFEDTGHILEQILALPSLSDADLRAAAEATQLSLAANQKYFFGGGQSTVESPPVGPYDPTPRPLPVEYEIVALGIDPSLLEKPYDPQYQTDAQGVAGP